MLLRKVTIQNFRGFERIDVDLDRTTVLIGENNSGKSSFLDALRLCLERSLSRRGNPFDDYDYHLPSRNAQPSDCGPLSVTLHFAEGKPDEWDAEVVQELNDVVVIHPGDLRHITLRVVSRFDKPMGDFLAEWEFLDAVGKPLPPKTKRPQLLHRLQQLNPVFHLGAVRDVVREFQPRGSLWGRFLRNPAMSPEARAALEQELTALNIKILQAEPRLQQVQDTLAKAQELVELASHATVSIEALPGRIWDILSRAQVNVSGATGANLPLARHGSGTQSLSVIFLFEAFLAVMLAQTFDKHSEPILTVEEPGAHLHPCAIRSLWKTLDTLTGQKIIATHSGDLLAEAPLTAIRRFHRVGGKVEVRRVQPGTLTASDARKLHFHLQKTRGELLFANCWLLVEGATEYWVFSETARLLDVDLERLGIRMVMYRQVEAAPFVKIAHDLGICWHCVVDGDATGQQTRSSLLPYLHGRREPEVLTVLPYDNIELFLCENGLGKVYLAHVAPQKAGQLTKKPGDPGYWQQVLSCVPNRYPKEQLAIDAMTEMRRQGKSAVPQVLQTIVHQSAALAGA